MRIILILIVGFISSGCLSRSESPIISGEARSFNELPLFYVGITQGDGSILWMQDSKYYRGNVSIRDDYKYFRLRSRDALIQLNNVKFIGSRIKFDSDGYSQPTYGKSNVDDMPKGKINKFYLGWFERTSDGNYKYKTMELNCAIEIIEIGMLEIDSIKVYKIKFQG